MNLVYNNPALFSQSIVILIYCKQRGRADEDNICNERREGGLTGDDSSQTFDPPN